MGFWRRGPGRGRPRWSGQAATDHDRVVTRGNSAARGRSRGRCQWSSCSPRGATQRKVRLTTRSTLLSNRCWQTSIWRGPREHPAMTERAVPWQSAAKQHLMPISSDMKSLSEEGDDHQRGEGSTCSTIRGGRYIDGLSGLYCASCSAIPTVMRRRRRPRTDEEAALRDQLDGRPSAFDRAGLRRSLACAGGDEQGHFHPGGSSRSRRPEAMVQSSEVNGHERRRKVIARKRLSRATMGALSFTGIPDSRRTLRPARWDPHRPRREHPATITGRH